MYACMQPRRDTVSDARTIDREGVEEWLERSLAAQYHNTETTPYARSSLGSVSLACLHLWPHLQCVYIVLNFCTKSPQLKDMFRLAVVTWPRRNHVCAWYMANIQPLSDDTAITLQGRCRQSAPHVSRRRALVVGECQTWFRLRGRRSSLLVTSGLSADYTTFPGCKM